MSRSRWFLVVALGVASLTAACGSSAQAGVAVTGEEKPAPSAAHIVDVLEEDGRFTVLLELLRTARATEALEGPVPLTVFAPTDEAFASVPAETLAELQEDRPALEDVLLYHVVEGELTGADVGAASTLTMMNGVDWSVDPSVVVDADIDAPNGTIHAIDTVLLP